MGTQGRRTLTPLSRELAEEPFRFDFFQAVRLLERLFPDRAPVGRDSRKEIVRFRALLSLAFPPSSLYSLDLPEESEDRPPYLVVNFFGMTGPSGALPVCYTEELLQRSKQGDRVLAQFLDIFNHRLISLFFRAWEKYRPIVTHERDDARFSDNLFHLLGLGPRSFRNRHAVPDGVLPYYAGLFTKRHRTSVGLQQILLDYFEEPIEVLQFQGRWLKIDPADQSRMGSSGPHNQLGVDLVVGTRVWDNQSKFRLRVGPLTFREYRKFLPDGAAFRPLSELARLYVDSEFDFDVQLVLQAEEVPSCQLISKRGKGSRLGRFAWLKSEPSRKDADEAIFASTV